MKLSSRILGLSELGLGIPQPVDRRLRLVRPSHAGHDGGGR